MPSFPYINREVKCSFRWYRDPLLRNRNLRRCKAEDDTCSVFAINTPITRLPPFQIYAGDSPIIGLSTITSWKIYDLNGNEVLDLTSDSGLLNVTQFNTFWYIDYDGSFLSQPLPQSSDDTLYESVIVTAGIGIDDPTIGTYYSETFRVACAQLNEDDPLENTDLTDGFTNWSYGEWAGLIVDVEDTAGDPSYPDPNEGDRVINIDDELLYTWTSGAWVSSTPANGTFFSEAAIGSQWYIFNSGAFASAVANFPVTLFEDTPGQLICWNGNGDPVVEYMPSGPSFPVVAQISVTASGSGGNGDTVVSGAGSSGANGTYVASGTFNGKPQYFLGGLGPEEITWQFTNKWVILFGGGQYESSENVAFPWLVTSWTPALGASAPAPTVTEDGSSMSGTLDVVVNGVTIMTLTSAENGVEQVANVLLNGSDPIQFVPTDFVGCVTFFEGLAYTDTETCQYALEYWNCGDFATHYYSAGWRDRIYLGNPIYLGQTESEITVEQDEDNQGAPIDTFRRKQNKYRFELGPIPWYLKDALGEIPLHDSVTIRDLSAPLTVPSDFITDVSIEAPWGQDRCLTAASRIIFSVDDASVNSGCCETFIAPCLDPCIAASGFNDTETPVDGRYYIDRNSATFQQYLTGSGFGAVQPCTSGLASGEGGFLDRYWDGSAWVRLAAFTFEYDTIGCATMPTITITGTMNPRYNARLQYSFDNVSFFSFDPDITFSPAALENFISLPMNAAIVDNVTAFLRLQVFGHDDCVIGYSNVCEFTCQSMIEGPLGQLIDNGWALVGGSHFTSYATYGDLPGAAIDGDIAYVIALGYFYVWQDSDFAWHGPLLISEAPPPPTVVGLQNPGRFCIYAPIDAMVATMSTSTGTSGRYQLQIEVDGTLKGKMHFPSTFQYNNFSGAGYYTAIVTDPVVDTTSVYIDFGPEDGIGCILGISVRPLCVDEDLDI